MVEREAPHSTELEKALLGAMLIDQEVIPRVLEYVDKSCFYSESHQIIFNIIVSLFERNAVVDVNTVVEELRRQNLLEEVGGREELANLSNYVLTTAGVEEWAKLVLEKAIKRKLMQVATQIVKETCEDKLPVDELLDRAESMIFSIKEARIRKGFVSIKEVLKETLKDIEEASQKKKFFTGLETGFSKLDEMTSGIQNGDLIIIAGRPSMGKTAFALNLATNIAVRNRVPIAFFSLEMSKELLIQRLICSEAKISLRALRAGQISRDAWQRISMACGVFYDIEFFIDDSPRLSVLDIRAKARRLKSEVPLGLVVIDYLQLIEGVRESRSATRQEVISEISRSLKAMAKELNIPVICLSQLSRSPERRDPKRPIPQLADLRESGAIEQDADLVILLYRDEFYNEDSPEKGMARIIIAKQRNGPTGQFKLAFLSEYMRFDNLTFEEDVELE
ncbi:MAG: replicative DNA helicase [candidate division WOR-3 bacterium]|nr:replicative DNA helicase [candidate division WOR-3 bacterium]MCX7836787.1 replicative DNA helicase [candidate division WOR-3 bacterium]MDW8113575.1 replicative DNA helicase [candidate division WOR-3 bacterium]